jgi:hypothetical protein
VSGGAGLAAAVRLLRRRTPQLPCTPQPAPPRGRWVGANPEPAPRTDAPPTANPPPIGAREEVNRMRRPSLEELQHQVEEDGGCEATDGCVVEPDGTCEHGQPSWLLALGLI